jgi:hypothetical protein
MAHHRLAQGVAGGMAAPPRRSMMPPRPASLELRRHGMVGVHPLDAAVDTRYSGESPTLIQLSVASLDQRRDEVEPMPSSVGSAGAASPTARLAASSASSGRAACRSP